MVTHLINMINNTLPELRRRFEVSIQNLPPGEKEKYIDEFNYLEYIVKTKNGQIRMKAFNKLVKLIESISC